jgi:hypothetical protein
MNNMLTTYTWMSVLIWLYIGHGKNFRKYKTWHVFMITLLISILDDNDTNNTQNCLIWASNFLNMGAILSFEVINYPQNNGNDQ